MEDIVNLISNFGFPMALVIYLLLTRDKVIQKNTDAIIDLRKVIEIRGK